MGFNSIPTELFYVECEDTRTLLCEERELAVGELAVIVEKLSINSNIVPLDNYADKCNECKFRNALGYIKLEFDKYDNFLPKVNFLFIHLMMRFHGNQLVTQEQLVKS